MKSPILADFLAAGGVLLAGGAILLLTRRLTRSSASASASSCSTSSFPPDAPSATPTNVESHKWARSIVTAAFKQAIGREPTLAELQYGQAVCWLETRYGKGWKPAMSGAKNWGAVQCRGSAQVSGQSVLLGGVDADAEPIATGAGDCIEYEDSFADGTRYKVSFRAYASDVDGAADVMRHVFKLRPRTAQALAEKGATAFRASWAMRRERYYEGFCPVATKRFGSSSVRASLAHPDRSEATRACAQEAISAHAKSISEIIQNIASACGDPIALPLGTFEDGERWYRCSFPDAAVDASTAPKAAPAASTASKAATSSSSTTTSPATSSSSSTTTSPPSSSAPRILAGDAGHRLLQAVQAGQIEPPTWIEVPWTAAGVVLRVSADALRAPVDGKSLRLPVSWAESMEIDRALDCVPLTAEISDLIWQASTMKVDPRPLGEWSTPEQQKASSVGMRSLDWCARFTDSLDSRIAGHSGLVADVGKDWILSPRLLLQPALGVTYGWRYSTGKPIQGLGSEKELPAHNDQHYDYSQTKRLVQRWTVDGQDVLKVYQSRGLDPRVVALFSGGAK